MILFGNGIVTDKQHETIPKNATPSVSFNESPSGRGTGIIS
jgi:hypothetical protein